MQVTLVRDGKNERRWVIWGQVRSVLSNSSEVTFENGGSCVVGLKSSIETNRLPLARNLVRFSNGAQIFATSAKSSMTFLEISRSSMPFFHYAQVSQDPPTRAPVHRLLGHVLRMTSKSSALLMQKPSRRMIFSLCKCDSFSRILSKPTSSMTLLRETDTAKYGVLGSSAVVYFLRRAVKNEMAGSGVREGRMNEPEDGTVPVRFGLLRDSMGDDSRCSHSKYCRPLCSPECFPRRMLSHSTPSHSPVVPSTSPIYRTVQRSPE